MKIKTEYIILVFILLLTVFIISQKSKIDGFTRGRPPSSSASRSNNNNNNKGVGGGGGGGGGGSACIIM